MRLWKMWPTIDKDTFGSRFQRKAVKLAFQARNTHHQHMLLFLEQGIIEDFNVIESEISAKHPYLQPGKKSFVIVKKYDWHHYSA